MVRDLPRALVDEGWSVAVATPSYGSLHKVPGAACVATLNVGFRGASLPVDIWRLRNDSTGVDNVIFDHELFSAEGTGRIYFGNEPARPFATDADKFALYCAAAAEWIFSGEKLPDVVHLHDWHAAFYLLLTNYKERYRHLAEIRTVFTVHNLSYQGIRPLDGDVSSLAAWYPDIEVDLHQVRDPRYHNCVNPMAAAIRLADKVSTVSPTYAKEICLPSNPATGFVGGEGLEADLVAARDDGRLSGVLNGCFYDEPLGRRPGWQKIRQMIETQLHQWLESQPDNEAHRAALLQLEKLPKRRPAHVLTSIGRLVPQKASLMLTDIGDGGSALQHIASRLDRSGVILIIGSGDPELEAMMLEQTQHIDNVLFLNGYSETLAAPLYRAGDLFLMPSSFEPCGISQMLAMRAGQPCVVHGVGGLRDTVEHDATGFVFGGTTPHEQALRFVQVTIDAIRMRAADPVRWQQICRMAMQQRYDWQSSARQTIQALYGELNDR
ncbi:MAG: glycogen/starch synthase [Gammaproteobacteria bacterium]|nr:glycogen/starch synthase [Gammaproteobacteria bacterium]